MQSEMIKSTLKQLQKVLLSLFVVTGMFLILNNNQILIESVENSQKMIFWILFFTFFILSIFLFTRENTKDVPPSNAAYYPGLSKIIDRFLVIMFSLVISIIASFLTRFFMNFVISYF